MKDNNSKLIVFLHLNQNFFPQEFLFTTLVTDKLEVELKDKFAKSRPTISRNLGRLRINITQLLHELKPGKPSHVAYSLSTAENPCSSSLRFRVTLCHDQNSIVNRRSPLLLRQVAAAGAAAASPTVPTADLLAAPRQSLPLPDGAAASGKFSTFPRTKYSSTIRQLRQVERSTFPRAVMR